jgi:hypothetical protein
VTKDERTQIGHTDRDGVGISQRAKFPVVYLGNSPEEQRIRRSRG